MPNWCDNTLTITGPEAEIERFIKESTGLPPEYYRDDSHLTEKEKEVFETEKEVEPEELNFHSLVPIPDETLKFGFSHKYEKDADGNFKPRPEDPECGYDAQCRLWGTKWGASGVVMTTSDSCTNWCPATEYETDTWVSYSFDTAWSPPEPWVRAVSPMFPFCIFNLTFKEEGMGYRGQLMIKKGVELIEETSSTTFQDYVNDEGEHYAWDCYDLHEKLEEINGGNEAFHKSKKEATNE